MTITHESHVTITADGLQTWVHWTWPHILWSKSTNFGLTHLSYFILYPMIQWKISSPNKQKAILHTSPHWTWLKHSNSLNSLNLKLAETCGHTNPIPIIPVMSQVMPGTSMEVSKKWGYSAGNNCKPSGVSPGEIAWMSLFCQCQKQTQN